MYERTHFIRSAVLVSALASVYGCNRDSTGPASSIKPQEVTVSAPAAPGNVLSARITFSEFDTPDSVRVSYQEKGGPVQTTPAIKTEIGSNTIGVLGLKPLTSYSCTIQAFLDGQVATSNCGFGTEALPQDLADIKLNVMSGSTSFYTATGVATASGGYAVIFAPDGTIAWYHNFTSTGLPVSNVVMQPNGNITAFLGTTAGWQAATGYYVEITPLGDEVARYTAPTGYYVDDHEIRLTGSGATKEAHYFTYDIRSSDLSMFGMSSSIPNAGHQIVRTSSGGAIDFSWDAWDHLGFDEWIGDESLKATRTETDFDHPNALNFDNEGNYIVSWRNLDQIMRINSTTGEVIDRIGGVKSDYTFVNDPKNGFHKQHSPSILPNGNLLVYDNGTGENPDETRAVEYSLDRTTHTATLVWEYRHDPAIYTAYVGWLERLSSGSTWVGYALAGRVVQVSASGSVQWESQLKINGNNGSVYRLVPIVSLYKFVMP